MSEHVVGSVDEFPPGSHKVVAVGRAKVGVFNVEGRFYALPNVCPHQAGPLCEGRVSGTTACSAETDWRFAWVRDGQVVACPWHGMEFDVTTGRSLSSPTLRVRTYAVAVEDGLVKVTLSAPKAAAS